MDTSQFGPDTPGEIVAIERGEHAFVPHPLPPPWDFPIRLWPLLAEAKQQLGILEGLGRNLPNPTLLLRPLEDREAIKSSRLEGTYVTARELILYEMGLKASGIESDSVDNQREVLNYRKALHEGANSALPLSLRLIRELHRTLLHGVRGRDRSPGNFRSVQVAIGSQRRFVPPPPQRLMECLALLEKHFHADRPEYDPLVDCFLIHYQFETIHPFVDGNGRVGRLLLAIMLKERCGLSKPWLYMSDYFDNHREEYIQRLFNVSALGDWEGWIELCLTGTSHQVQDTIQRCERLLKIREGFVARVGEVGGSIRLSQIVEGIFFSPFVRVVDLVERLNVTYPTAKADVERLVDAGILKELGSVSPKTFYCPDVFNIAYEEME